MFRGSGLLTISLLILCFLPAASAQQTSTPVQDKRFSEMAAIVEREFGPEFKLMTKTPPMMADFDGDGREDLAVVATGGHVLGAASRFHYTVADPYNRYFGLSDPKITTQFSASDPQAQRYLLIIHRWREPQPGSKFVLINIPFEKIQLGYMQLRRHTIPAIETCDEVGIQAAVYWDGHRYRWEAIGMDGR